MATFPTEAPTATDAYASSAAATNSDAALATAPAAAADAAAAEASTLGRGGHDLRRCRSDRDLRDRGIDRVATAASGAAAPTSTEGDRGVSLAEALASLRSDTISLILGHIGGSGGARPDTFSNAVGDAEARRWPAADAPPAPHRTTAAARPPPVHVGPAPRSRRASPRGGVDPARVRRTSRRCLGGRPLRRRAGRRGVAARGGWAEVVGRGRGRGRRRSGFGWWKMGRW